MSYFKAKLHQIRFRLGLLPRPLWGSLQPSLRPQLDLRGPAFKGKERRRRKGPKGRGRKGVRGRESEGGQVDITCPGFF